MAQELRFALVAIKKNIKSGAELRASFVMNIFGMMINNISLIILWAFFIQSVGTVGGWTVPYVIGLQGFAALSFGLIFSIGAGIRRLPEHIASGAFDRFMLSPKNLLLRVATSSLNSSALGDVVFGIICFFIFGALIDASAGQILIIGLLAIFSIVIFFSVSVIVFSAGFFFMDSSAAANGLFELFFTPALFNGGAFQGVMRFVFTFLVPSLAVAALPVEAAADFSFAKLALVGILAALWFFISIGFFRRAVRRYESSNFMTFGG